MFTNFMKWKCWVLWPQVQAVEVCGIYGKCSSICSCGCDKQLVVCSGWVWWYSCSGYSGSVRPKDWPMEDCGLYEEQKAPCCNWNVDLSTAWHHYNFRYVNLHIFISSLKVIIILLLLLLLLLLLPVIITIIVCNNIANNNAKLVCSQGCAWLRHICRPGMLKRWVLGNKNLKFRTALIT